MYWVRYVFLQINCLVIHPRTSFNQFKGDYVIESLFPKLNRNLQVIEVRQDFKSGKVLKASSSLCYNGFIGKMYLVAPIDNGN